jgi:hypothetical protein
MKRGMLAAIFVIILFLISFTAAAITSRIIENNTKNQKSGENKLTDSQITNMFTAKNKIKVSAETGECPNNCTCTANVTKCIFANRGKEMTVVAGKSGIVIMQVKGVNASASVTLYKSDGKIYAVNKDNETREIKMFPNQVRERIRERLQRQLENENITLDNNSLYQYKAEKRARLFLLFPVRVAVQAELNPETGKVLRLRNSWWSFLAKDESSGQLIGTSCGTVTPGYNDECCQNKDYDFWNATSEECEFNASE